MYTCFILQHNVNAFTTMLLYLYNTRYTMSISFQSTYCFPCGTNYIFLDDGQISYTQRFSRTTRSYKITVILTDTNVRAAAGPSSRMHSTTACDTLQFSKGTSISNRSHLSRIISQQPQKDDGLCLPLTSSMHLHAQFIFFFLGSFPL